MAVLKNHHIKKENFIFFKKNHMRYTPVTDSPCSVFSRSQWREGQKAMGVRLAPSCRCPRCHFWGPMVSAQSGRNVID